MEVRGSQLPTMAAVAVRAGASALVLLGALAGCAATDGAAQRSAPAVDGFLGVYRGSFGDALTQDPADDLNYNPCEPARERCLGGDDPLADILLELVRGEDDHVRLVFFRSAADRAGGVPLDLLGRGCGTRMEALRELARDPESGNLIAVFPVAAANRLCLNKLRPTTGHEIRVELGHDPDAGTAFAEARIDRDVVSENHLYVTEGGTRRRVRMDLDNTMESGPERRYRVCIEDDLGEYTRCVLTDRALKRIVLPVPLPGGVGGSYTWWEELTPDLKRTRGLYRLETYSGRFVLVAPARERE